jgi:hypothetical protein
MLGGASDRQSPVRPYADEEGTTLRHNARIHRGKSRNNRDKQPRLCAPRIVSLILPEARGAATPAEAER